MNIKKLFNWCLKNYKLLLAVGAFLLIVNYSLEIIKNVGITVDLPEYWNYFNALEPNIKMYTLAAANFIFTIVFVLLIASPNKKND